MVCLLAAPLVQLSVSAGNGWPHNALRHHWLMPISYHFRDCKALLVTSLTHVSGAIASVQTFAFALTGAQLGPKCMSSSKTGVARVLHWVLRQYCHTQLWRRGWCDPIVDDFTSSNLLRLVKLNGYSCFTECTTLSVLVHHTLTAVAVAVGIGT